MLRGGPGAGLVERFATVRLKVTTNQQNIMEKVEEILVELKEFRAEMNCQLDKKADKWVEKAVVWIMIICATTMIAIIGFLLDQIFFKK